MRRSCNTFQCSLLHTFGMSTALQYLFFKMTNLAARSKVNMVLGFIVLIIKTPNTSRSPFSKKIKHLITPNCTVQVLINVVGCTTSITQIFNSTWTSFGKNFNLALHSQRGLSSCNNPINSHLLFTMCVHVWGCFLMMLHSENLLKPMDSFGTWQNLKLIYIFFVNAEFYRAVMNY